MRAGPIPATKRSPMLCSVMMPWRISRSEGGISIHNTDEPATTPVAKRGA